MRSPFGPTKEEIAAEKEAIAVGKAVAAQFQESCPNLIAHFPQPADEENYDEMLASVEAYILAAAPASVIRYTLFARAIVNAIQSRLFKFRDFALASLAGQEFDALVEESKKLLPFDHTPESPEAVAAGVQAVFTNF
jgi:hypothetical protein